MRGGVWRHLGEAIAADGIGVMVSVLSVAGSAPREAGARMVMRSSGGFHGTIGGGELEWQALADAHALIDDGSGAAVRRRSFALGPELGQCCGGRVELLFERFSAHDSEAVARLADAETRGGFQTQARMAGATRLDRVVAETRGEAHGPALRLERDGLLIERFGSTDQPLLLFGAGHVGRSLILALAPLPFKVSWIDSRADAFPAATPANVVCIHARAPSTALEGAPDGAFVLAMTHSHGLDLEIVHAALAAERFSHVGLIGSATKRARFESRMRAGGLREAQISALVCPIGVGGINSREPAIIAAACVAQLLAQREAVANDASASNEGGLRRSVRALS